MELPQSKVRQAYIDQIKIIEANIQDVADGEAPRELYELAQKKLDKLAERFQGDNEIGPAKYKMYELQALLYYFQDKDDEALDFINEAVKTRGDLYRRAEKLIQNIESSKSQTKKNKSNVVFFHRSPLAVALLMIFTLNIYSLYWVAKHWRAIQVGTGEKTFPILSAIFQVFTIYPLFKQIRSHANRSGYMKFRRVGLAAFAYIVLLFVSNAIWRIEPTTTADAATSVFFAFLFTAGAAVILSVVQRAANAHNVATLGKRHVFKKLFVGEAIITIIGLIIGIAAIIATFNMVGTVSSDSLSPEANDAYQRMESLRSEYDSCSSDLEARRDGVNIYSDYAVDAFNRDLAACEDARLELNRTVDEYNRLAGFE